MSNANAQVRELFEVRLDRKGLFLAVLFAVVIGASLYLRTLVVGAGVEPITGGKSPAEQAAGGAAIALVEVVYASVLLGLIMAWRWLPEWLKELFRPVGKAGLLMAVGAGVFTLGGWTAIGFFTAAVFAAKTIDHFDMWWVINNLSALLLAVYVAVSWGVLFGPWVIGVLAVGLTVYDYVFADKRTWMLQLAAWTIRYRIPAVFIVPNGWRLDWEDLEAALTDDGGGEEEHIGFAIGTGDLLLPAAFAVALAQIGGGAPLVGAVAGTLLACARVSWKLDNGGGAGLPPLVTGALGGWAVAAVVGVMVA